MIELHNVSKRYPGGFEALHQVSLDIDGGEMAFLTGHSGAGKSTLLKLIALIERPTHGRITFGGANLAKVPDTQIPNIRRHMGIIFQDALLIDDRSILDNVALPLEIAGYKPSDIKRRARAALDKVGLLTKEQCYPIELSGGEQQRVGIARACVHKPKLLLADEPTGNLDPKLSAEIMNLFAEFNSVGVTVLIASHDLSLIQTFNKRIIALDHGSLKQPQTELAYV